MLVLSMLFSILISMPVAKQYVSTVTRGQDSPTLFFQNYKNKIASYPSAIIFSLIIREYDIISPH